MSQQTLAMTYRDPSIGRGITGFCDARKFAKPAATSGKGNPCLSNTCQPWQAKTEHPTVALRRNRRSEIRKGGRMAHFLKKIKRRLNSLQTREQN